MVSTLLERGAEVGATDDEGGTALHYAAMGGHEEIAQVLRMSRGSKCCLVS